MAKCFQQKTGARPDLIHGDHRKNVSIYKSSRYTKLEDISLLTL